MVPLVAYSSKGRSLNNEKTKSNRTFNPGSPRFFRQRGVKQIVPTHTLPPNTYTHPRCSKPFTSELLKLQACTVPGIRASRSFISLQTSLPVYFPRKHDNSNETNRSYNKISTRKSVCCSSEVPPLPGRTNPHTHWTGAYVTGHGCKGVTPHTHHRAAEPVAHSLLPGQRF